MRAVTMFTAALLALGAGCGGGVDFGTPPDLLLGQDVCEHCRMIISEARFAACGYGADGTAYRFDDVGCLVRYLDGATRPARALWIHDYTGDAWLPAREATLVVSEKIHTAMGSGIVAVAASEQADQLAKDHGGKVTTLGELLAAPPAE